MDTSLHICPFPSSFEVSILLSNPLETTVTLQTSGGTTQSGSMRLPPSNESFTFDNRGNLTSDGLWDYGWDAQNRLIWAQSRAWTAQTRRLDLVYDGLGRRIQRVLKVNGGVVENTVYVYDGWLLLAELDGLNNQALLRGYGWGLDLSGTMSRAGGVGGLLWVYNSSNGQVHDAVCDGQGNVTGLIEASTGQISARYEYSPFGELIRQTGPMAPPNPFRFSTKYTDNETELVYYGYRYYSPTMGRWLSRDPIEEFGGLNVYGFLNNSVPNFVDDLGCRGLGTIGTANPQNVKPAVDLLVEAGMSETELGLGVIGGVAVGFTPDLLPHEQEVKNPETYSPPLLPSLSSDRIPFTSESLRLNKGSKCACPLLKDGEGVIDYGKITNEKRSGVLAWVTRSFADTHGSYADINIRPPGFKYPTMARGHLWGRQNGGSGKVESNLVTILHKPVNNSEMVKEEYKIRGALNAGKTVCGYSIPIYVNKNIPAYIWLFAMDSDGNILVNKPIKNPPGF